MSSRARILVVDDEPVILRVITEMLEGVDVRCVGTHAEGLRAILTTSFDAALFDKNLPDGSGLTLARALRERDPDVSTILLTGYPSIESAVQAMGLGIDDYVAKPFNAAELELKLRHAVDRTRLRRETGRLREGIRQSEELYRELVSASPDAIVFVDVATQRVLMANAAASRLYGYSQTELIGLSSRALLADVEAHGLARAKATDLQGAVVRQDRTKAGTTVPVEVSTGFSRFGGKEVMVWVVRDISERLRLEQEQQRSQRMQTIGKLAGGVAHDLNNLICVLECSLVALNGILEASPPKRKDDVRELLGELRYVCDAQARLTRQLGVLGASGPGAAQIVNIAEVLDDLKKLLARTLEANVSLVVSTAPGLLAVRMDRGELEQVIVNLVVNARDAMPEGGGLVITAKRPESAGGAVIELRVQDTGTGIPETVLPHIFETFFTTKQPGKGTGMGLATVARIIEKAGGTIRAESKVGAGTTFIIRLPALSGEVVSTSATQRAHLGRGERILVVDDDEMVRRTVTRILASAGYAVLHASYAAHALEILATSIAAVDLVLTDVVMPDLSGPKLAERIAEQQPNTKVVFMSGYERSVGTDRLLAKPFSPQTLLSFVAEQLGSS